MTQEKPSYKRNWSEYNEQLVRRGEIYLDIEFLKNWSKEINQLNANKVGSPYIYPNSLIEFQAILHQLLHIDYRGIEGFTRKLSQLAGNFPINDYSTICRRVNKLNLNFDLNDYNNGEPIVIAFDASGVKVTNRGEWIRDKYKKRKGWVKVVIAVDVKKKKVIAMKVGEEIGLSESRAAKEIILNLHYEGIKIDEIIGDGSYDDKELFEICRKLNIKPTIRIRKNSCKKARGSIFRKKHVIEFKELGYEEWSKKHKYGRRWIAESEFSRVKRKTGEFVMAKNKQNMFKEAMMKFYFYNLLMKYGENAEIFHQI